MAVKRLLSDLERALSRLEEAYARALNSPIFSRLPGYMEAVRYVLEVMREKVG